MDDDASDGGLTVVNIYDTDEYKEMAKVAYDWNQKGYFMPDSTTNTTPRQDILKANNAFGKLRKLSSGYCNPGGYEYRYGHCSNANHRKISFHTVCG